MTTIFTRLPCLIVLGASFLMACTADSEQLGAAGQGLLGIDLNCDPSLSEECRQARHEEGRRLFEEETFGGNGRTCLTCHSKETGTFNLEDVANRLKKGSGSLTNGVAHSGNSGNDDELFVWDGLDDFHSGTTRISAEGTILVELPLPDNIWLVDDPTAETVVLERGVPSTINTPALDWALMYDLRAPDLKEQARGAIRGHAQATIEPTELQLELIAEFQQNDERFFSNEQLRDYAAGGPPPQLPPGVTDAEKRGREFFVDQPLVEGSNRGACALCHSGPMLNKISAFGTAATGGAPADWPLFDIGVQDVNETNRPVRTYGVVDDCGNYREVTTPDPGLMLSDPLTNPRLHFFYASAAACEIHPTFFNQFVKIPTLWGVSKTAPYFHDNSAATLEDVMDHYLFFFQNSESLGGKIHLTQQDVDDILAYLRLL